MPDVLSFVSTMSEGNPLLLKRPTGAHPTLASVCEPAQREKPIRSQARFSNVTGFKLLRYPHRRRAPRRVASHRRLARSNIGGGAPRLVIGRGKALFRFLKEDLVLRGSSECNPQTRA
jgi:hypothetical protein